MLTIAARCSIIIIAKGRYKKKKNKGEHENEKLENLETLRQGRQPDCRRSQERRPEDRFRAVRVLRNLQRQAVPHGREPHQVRFFFFFFLFIIRLCVCMYTRMRARTCVIN